MTMRSRWSTWMEAVAGRRCWRPSCTTYARSQQIWTLHKWLVSLVSWHLYSWWVWRLVKHIYFNIYIRQQRQWGWLTSSKFDNWWYENNEWWWQVTHGFYQWVRAVSVAWDFKTYPQEGRNLMWSPGQVVDGSKTNITSFQHITQDTVALLINKTLLEDRTVGMLITVTVPVTHIIDILTDCTIFYLCILFICSPVISCIVPLH